MDPDVTCLTDDPAGLLRVGDGRFAAGSSGPNNTPGTVIHVTNCETCASGPSCPNYVGSLRWAYGQINGPSKVVVDAGVGATCPAQHTGTFPVGFALRWDKPYTTLDCSADDVTWRTGDDNPGSQVMYVTATHDVIFYGCRFAGRFNETSPQLPQNNMTLIGSTGHSNPVFYSWDDEWDENGGCASHASKCDTDGGADPGQCGGNPPIACCNVGGTTNCKATNVQDAIFDRNTCRNIQDDCLIVYEGVRDVTISRNFVRRGWHPMTAGAGGYRSQTAVPHSQRFDTRQRITWYANVTYRNGARQPRLFRGIYDFSIYNNVWGFWYPYAAPPSNPVEISPNSALWFEDDSPLEFDKGRVANNFAVPGPAFPNGAKYPNNACLVGGSPDCDLEGGDSNRCVTKNGKTVCGYAACNPKLGCGAIVGGDPTDDFCYSDNAPNNPVHIWIDSSNDWGTGNVDDCFTWPEGYTPAARTGGLPPLPILTARTKQQVLDEAGPPIRKPEEQVDIEWIESH